MLRTCMNLPLPLKFSLSCHNARITNKISVSKRLKASPCKLLPHWNYNVLLDLLKTPQVVDFPWEKTNIYIYICRALGYLHFDISALPWTASCAREPQVWFKRRGVRLAKHGPCSTKRTEKPKDPSATPSGSPGKALDNHHQQAQASSTNQKNTQKQPQKVDESGVIKHNPSISTFRDPKHAIGAIYTFQYSAAQTTIPALQSVAVTSVMAASFKPGSRAHRHIVQPSWSRQYMDNTTWNFQGNSILMSCLNSHMFYLLHDDYEYIYRRILILQRFRHSVHSSLSEFKECLCMANKILDLKRTSVESTCRFLRCACGNGPRHFPKYRQIEWAIDWYMD